MIYNLHVLTTVSCEQLHEWAGRVVFTLQRYKLLQVFPAGGGNSSGRKFILVIWCPRLPKFYPYMTGTTCCQAAFQFHSAYIHENH